MLEALVIAGIIAAPLGSAALFLPARRRVRVAGTWPAVRRFVLAIIGTVVLAADNKTGSNHLTLFPGAQQAH